jgi:UPF0176 protein
LRYVVCAIYKFVALDHYKALREPLLEAMQNNSIRGTLLLANEGINGTVAGTREGIDRLLMHIASDPCLEGFNAKESFSEEVPFHRTKVKLKNEIVTMGVEGIDPNNVVGTYVQPKDWNALISDPGVTTIDTRNQYEVGIGTFQNAVDPHTDSFCEFPNYVGKHLDPAHHKRVAMFCTGGIRCEKATAYLKGQGFDHVYHLQGGILNYLRDVPEPESLWQGECFVFDRRVAVTHGLKQGRHDLCYACRYPISEDDKKQATYTKGVSCPRCYDQTTAPQRKRFQDRQTQVQLAHARGEQHIGRPLPR